MKLNLIVSTPFEGKHPARVVSRERYAANKAVAELMLGVWGSHDGPLCPVFRFLHRANGVVAVKAELVDGSSTDARAVPWRETAPVDKREQCFAFQTTARLLDPAVDPFIYAPLILYARQQMNPAPAYITVEHYENTSTKLVDLQIVMPGGAPKDQGASI